MKVHRFSKGLSLRSESSPEPVRSLQRLATSTILDADAATTNFDAVANDVAAVLVSCYCYYLMLLVVGDAASNLAPAANSDAASDVADVVVNLAATPSLVATATDAIRVVPAPKPLTQQLSLPL